MFNCTVGKWSEVVEVCSSSQLTRKCESAREAERAEKRIEEIVEVNRKMKDDGRAGEELGIFIPKRCMAEILPSVSQYALRPFGLVRGDED